MEGRGNGAGWDFVLAMSIVDGVWVMEAVEGGLRGGDGGGGMEDIWRREAGGGGDEGGRGDEGGGWSIINMKLKAWNVLNTTILLVMNKYGIEDF